MLSVPPKTLSSANTNASQTFTSKSNSKFVDFIWSKFTRPKNANKDKDCSNQIDGSSGKKQKRGIFNLFDR